MNNLKDESDSNERLVLIESLLKSDSVYWLLRFGFKCPSKSGMDNCDDNDYLDLYKICKDLRNE